MSEKSTLELARAACKPGETLAGTLVPIGAGELVLELVHHTRGKGDPERHVVATIQRVAEQAGQPVDFTFDLPAGPYSCIGRLVCVRWAVESRIEGTEEQVGEEFVLAPEGMPVELESLQNPEAKFGWVMRRIRKYWRD